ncbi:MAG: hypothetical protein Q4P30_05230 [Eubacteriales bacterium]|nr:hypothetical protein [Eubacteriales bacterium]
MEKRLNRAENMKLAEATYMDVIWQAALLEGVVVTRAETAAICEGRHENMDEETLLTITNLQHAWQTVFQTVDAPVDLKYICAMNRAVSKNESLAWGVLRNGRVGIGGTDYVPPIPEEQLVIEHLQAFAAHPGTPDNILNRMLWMMKAQLFWDGNRRTAMIVANKELIRNGYGILSVEPEKMARYNDTLSEYYSTGDMAVRHFLATECIRRRP